ncbi:MAG: hypothetical protein QM767_23295 [Anaeromyxobacter sp.]
MQTIRLAALLSLASLLAACPEPRVESQREPPRPPQATISAGAGNQPDVLGVPRPDGQEWYGIYIGGQKAGWVQQSVHREIRDGRDVLVATGQQHLKALGAGKQIERSLSEERVYEARPGGRLLSVRTTFSGDGGERVLTGGCARERCQLGSAPRGSSRRTAWWTGSPRPPSWPIRSGWRPRAAA